MECENIKFIRHDYYFDGQSKNNESFFVWLKILEQSFVEMKKQGIHEYVERPNAAFGGTIGFFGHMGGIPMNLFFMENKQFGEHVCFLFVYIK
jgi:hypothetical protein